MARGTPWAVHAVQQLMGAVGSKLLSGISQLRVDTATAASARVVTITDNGHYIQLPGMAHTFEYLTANEYNKWIIM